MYKIHCIENKSPSWQNYQNHRINSHEIQILQTNNYKEVVVNVKQIDKYVHNCIGRGTLGNRGINPLRRGGV